MNYKIFYQPQLEQDLLNVCPFINAAEATTEEPNEDWENGYKWVEQDLTTEEFNIVDTAANNHTCIDVKPSPVPPGSPTGR